MAALIAAVAQSGAAFGHADHVDAAAWTACETATLADACDYVDHDDNRYRGSCRLMSDTLMCVRNQPIERPDTLSDISGS